MVKKIILIALCILSLVLLIGCASNVYDIYCIGIIGVIIAILIVVGIRGCITLERQESINNFCIEEGFDYGKETVKNTAIECKNFDDDDIKKVSYGEWQSYRDAIKEGKD